jgi:hypothetical protein
LDPKNKFLKTGIGNLAWQEFLWGNCLTILDIDGERGSLVLLNGLRAQKRVIPEKHLRLFKYYCKGMSLR